MLETPRGTPKQPGHTGHTGAQILRRREDELSEEDSKITWPYWRLWAG